MNHIYKTRWSPVRQAWVVAHEKSAAHTKSTAKGLTLLGTTLLLASTLASAAYVEPGQIGKDQAHTWETPEYAGVIYKDDHTEVGSMWGLRAMNASSAYSLGYHGQNVTLGVMDSGALLTHPDFSPDRFKATHITGNFAKTKTDPVGEPYDISGDWIKGVNNSHGTRVAATMGANRDGEGMHGIAWGSEILVGNNCARDHKDEGRWDYGAFYQGYRAFVDGGAMIINSSFGPDIRRDVDSLKAYKGKSKKKLPKNYDKYDGILALATVPDVEYEYFIFRNHYQDTPTFMDAAWAAVKDTDTIQVFTAGNTWRENPFHRGLYPYFHPEAEGNWISISGLTKDDVMVDGKHKTLEGKYRAMDQTLYPAGFNNKKQKARGFNRPGLAKYWSLVSEGEYGAAATVDEETGEATYGSMSGTSMAAPLVSGAFGVLASRYPEMTGKQVREVLLSTAKHTNDDGTPMKGWSAPEGETDVKLGWGLPDLKAGLFGPKQFFTQSHFNYDLKGFDVWQNPISETALKQREREDKAWLMRLTDDGTLNGNVLADKGGVYKRDTEESVALVDLDDSLRVISEENARQWRQDYFDARAKDIREKVAHDHYRASLTKSGPGTLVVVTPTPSTYTGGTLLKAGELYGFSHSFGAAPIVVEGGTFGILPQFNDTTVTRQGWLDGTTAQPLADIVIKDGGTLNVMVSGDKTETHAKRLVLEKGAKVGLATLDVNPTGPAQSLAQQLRDQGGTLTARFVAEEGIENHTDLTSLAQADYALVHPSITLEKNALLITVASLSEEEKGAALAGLVANANEARVLDAMLAVDPAMETMIGAQTEALKAQLKKSANTGLNRVMTGHVLSATRVVDQWHENAVSRVPDADARSLWVTALGTKGALNAMGATTDITTRGVLVGFDVPVAALQVGALVGVADGQYTSDDAPKVSGHEVHAGLHLKARVKPIDLHAGVLYSDFQQGIDVSKSPEVRGHIAQVFSEVGYPLTYATPYVGLDWIRANHKRVTLDATKTPADQTLLRTSLGVRGHYDVRVKGLPLKLTGNLAWQRFTGDVTAKVTVSVGQNPVTLEGRALKNLARLSVGASAALSAKTTLGVTLDAQQGSGVKTHGLNVTFDYTF